MKISDYINDSEIRSRSRELLLKFVFDHHVKTRYFSIPCSWMLIDLGLAQYFSH